MLTDTYDAALNHAKEHFDQATAEHEMAILHDDGLYRHLRFAKPDSAFYWYDLITWPGCLVISGDMDAYHFTFWPLPDMFEFFEQGHGEINPHYWAEKLQGVRPAHSAKSYSEDKFKARVRAWFDERAAEMDEEAAAELLRAIDWELLGDYVAWTEDTARAALREFEYDPALREDSWEWDLREYDHHYLWCCWAIVAGIKQYRAAKG